MKRTIACVLALVLAMSLAFCVSAEEVKIVMTEEETTSEFVDTVGAMPEDDASEETINEAEEQEEVSAEIVIDQFAQQETASEEIETQQYAEEETGFWAWLKSVWQAILNFFGL